MFDVDNPTNEEEIITERIELVYVKPLSFADKIAIQQIELKPQQINVYVNHKG